MSNLGAYQTFTTVAKKLGGVENTVALIAGGGAAIGAAITFATGKLIEIKKKNKKNFDFSNCINYEVKVKGKSNKGIVFNPGDVFYVLQQDKDAVLIYKEAEKNNPYVVSSEFLKSISDFENLSE